jgi:hypothetical protein
MYRNMSLIAVVFVALHVLTAVADSYVSIPLTAAVVPLTSSLACCAGTSAAGCGARCTCWHT